MFDFLVNVVGISMTIVLISGAVGVSALIIRRSLGMASQKDLLDSETQIEIVKHRYHPPVPNSINLTWSPHTRTTAHPPDKTEGMPVEVPVVSPTLFADILQHVSNGQFVMGIKQDGKPIMGDWGRVYSAGIGGLQGVGKSWTAAFILCQSRMLGAEIWCIDPHAQSEDSLYNRVSPLLTRPVAVSQEEIRAMVGMLEEEIASRVHAGVFEPRIVVAIDEWSYLVYSQGVTELMSLLNKISTAGRKHGVFAMVIAHKWTVKEMGGNARNLLSAFYIHRMRRDEARAMTNLTELPSDLLQLGDGEAYLLDQSGNMSRVSIPRMKTQDIVDVSQRLKSGLGSTVVTRTAQEQQVIDLLKQGKSIKSIIKELWGVESGAAYQEAAKELRSVILGLVESR